MIRELAAAVWDVKDWIENTSGWTPALLHVHAGLALWLLAAALFRRRLHEWQPLLIVAVIELVNEMVDRLAKGSWRPINSVGDGAATLFWPLLITLYLRRRR